MKCAHALNSDECIDCGESTFFLNEYYMVHDWIFLSAFKDAVERDELQNIKGMLCIGCLETRIGRQLVGRDFTICPLNYTNVKEGSERLKNRLATPPMAWHQLELENETDPE